jgi:prephenate dehydratase
VRVAYLGPAGTFSEDAVRSSGLAGTDFEAVPVDTILQVIEAVAERRADRALVPIENSIEGSVRHTVDGLIAAADTVRIVGEYVHEVRSALITAHPTPLDRIEVVISHPQPLAQCARFLREELPGAELRVADSTSSAVRDVSLGGDGLAALGPAAAAPIYGCSVIREGIEDEPGNLTRFVWLAPSADADAERVFRGSEPDAAAAATEGAEPSSGWKTTVVFSDLGADHPGALVEALLEFSKRNINLARIESRPQRRRLGSYLFFIDIEGRDSDPGVAAALDGLRTKAGSVRVLGSYPGAAGPPAA